MKNTKILLKKGEVLIYDFGSIKIHNYNTNDNLNDQVIILEKEKKLLSSNHQLFMTITKS